MMIAFALILTACGGKESKEDVINSIEEKSDEVESYSTEMKLDIKVFDDNDTVTEESNGVLKVDMNEKTQESSGKMTQDGQIVEYYSTEETTYAQENDSGWMDMTAEADNFKHEETKYEGVAQIITNLKDEEDVEMEEEDGKFIFSFKGTNEKVYKALEEPYSLSFEDADTKDIEHDLTITVDSETYLIEELTNTMSLEVDGEKAKIIIGHTFDKINEIDAIEIPQEVIDEAEAQDVSNDMFNQDQDEGKEEETEEETEGENAAANATGEEETRVFTNDQGGITIKMVYYYKGDTVTKQTTENVIPYDAVGVETKEEAQALFDPEAEKMQGVDGITQEMTYTDTEAIETLEVNYENINFEEAQDLPGMELSGNFENGISMEQSANLLLEQGFQEE